MHRRMGTICFFFKKKYTVAMVGGVLCHEKYNIYIKIFPSTQVINYCLFS